MDRQSKLATREPHMHWVIESRPPYTEINPPEAPSLCVTVNVSTEQPMRGTERVDRKGNRCYPSFVSIDVGDDCWTVLTGTARDIAQALTDAADRADQIDQEDRAGV